MIPSPVRAKYSAALYVILVFASGILVGVVSHRLYVTTTVSATAKQPDSAPQTLAEVRKKYLDDMRAKVGVDERQLASVNQVLDETKRKFDDLKRKEKPLHDAIQQEQIDEISALLTPQQKVAYDDWRAERARLQAEAQKKKDQQKQK
jgi:hypothetical protein